MNTDKPSSLPQFPAGLLAFALVLTVAATGWLAWKLYDSNRFGEGLKHPQIRCVQLQGIRDLAGHLTQ